MSKQQIFMSYSRRNATFVERLVGDLREAAFDIWRDTENLIAGTPSWEKAIRMAIKEAAAIVLVASPDALESEYVQGELIVARLNNRPIYPIWAEGENWIDCVPLDMAKYQYIDGRGEHYANGLAELRKTLNRMVDRSEGAITLGLPTHETVELNLALFDSVSDLLIYIDVNYLAYWYNSWTYGDEWVLGNIHTKQLAVPWNWLTGNMWSDWEIVSKDLTLDQMSIRDQSYWAVWSVAPLRAAGIACNDITILEHVMHHGGERELWQLVSQNQLIEKPIEKVNPRMYRHHAIVLTFSRVLSKKRAAFVQAGG